MNNYIESKYTIIRINYQTKVDFTLEWYLKIITKNGFKSDTASEEFRGDALAPAALDRAMQALYKLQRNDELENIAVTYIKAIREAPQLFLSTADTELLSVEARFKYANIIRDKFEQYAKAALEYKKLNEQYVINKNDEVSGYLPKPNLSLNLIRLQGKFYEGWCYKESANQESAIVSPSVMETYTEATTLFKTNFQPLIDAPEIEIEDRDYYITKATKIFEKLAYEQYLAGEFYFKERKFKKAIAEYEKVLKVYPTSDYVKDARDRIKEILQKSGNKFGDKTNLLPESDDSNLFGETQTEKQLTPEKIAKIASDSTVFLRMNTGTTGSGFFVSPGLIATNFHVIAGQTKGYAYLINKNLHYAIVGVVATDEARDLAILKVRAFDVPPLPLGDSDNVEVGETVYAAGSPKGQIDTISDGIVSRLRPTEITRFRSNGQMVRAKRLQITVPTSPGSSGGPLLNSNGEVIGINHAGDHSPDAQNINLAIPVNYLEELLKRVGTPEPLKNFKITSR